MTEPGTRPRIALLADAGPTIGAGHVMRTLTFGAALRVAGADVVLVSRDLPASLRSRASGLGVPTIERRSPLTDLLAVEEVLGTACVAAVVDSYDISTEVAETLGARLPVTAIDDERWAPLVHPAVVLNQNIHADPAMYADLGPGTLLLLGPRWALIREEVRRRRGTGPRQPGQVLIALGGADVRSLTDRIAAACVAAGSVPVTATGLVAGHRGGASDPGAFAEALATCEVAIVGAGTTVWECLCLGTPTIALVTADNQLAIARSGLEAGVIHAAFDVRTEATVDAIATETALLSADGPRRRVLADAGMAVVDGEGAARAASAVMRLIS